MIRSYSTQRKTVQTPAKLEEGTVPVLGQESTDVDASGTTDMEMEDKVVMDASEA